MVHTVKDGNECQQIMNKHPLVMLKFSAVWCGPCKAVKPLIEKMEPQYPEVFMGDVDVDEAQDVASAYGVKAMPTFVFFHNGIETKRVVGGDIPSIVSALRELQSLAPTFGNGSRLGGTREKLDRESLRQLRLRSIQSKDKESKDKESTNDEKQPVKDVPVHNSASTASWSPIEFVQNLIRYVVLYIATLFSLDARGSAASLTRT